MLSGLDLFALVVVSAFMIGGALIDFLQLKVPNWLTFPMMVSAWAYTACLSFLTPVPSGTFLDSIALTAVGFLLLFPFYAVGGMGAGDVKLQMGFGAWIGVLFGLREGFWILLYGFCIAGIVGGLMALSMICWNRTWRANLSNLVTIWSDWMWSSSFTEVAQRAAERKSQMQLLPYGVPLCIGLLGHLYYFVFQQI